MALEGRRLRGRGLEINKKAAEREAEKPESRLRGKGLEIGRKIVAPETKDEVPPPTSKVGGETISKPEPEDKEIFGRLS